MGGNKILKMESLLQKTGKKQMVQFVYSGILNKILKKLKILMNFLSEILYCLM